MDWLMYYKEKPWGSDSINSCSGNVWKVCFYLMNNSLNIDVTKDVIFYTLTSITIHLLILNIMIYNFDHLFYARITSIYDPTQNYGIYVCLSVCLSVCIPVCLSQMLYIWINETTLSFVFYYRVANILTVPHKSTIKNQI